MLNYKVYGDLARQVTPLIVLHGLLGSLDNWHTFASRYSTEQPIVAIDMRNHGNSPHQVGMTYQLLVDDVLEVLQTLTIQTCDLMGHSMGGKAAMLIALQQPQLLKHLIVVDIAPVSYRPRLQSLLQAMNALPLDQITQRKQADEQLSQVVDNAFERGFLLKNLSRQPDGHFKWLANLPEITRHYLKITNFPEVTTTYAGPALFIAGRQSDYVTPETWQAAQALFPTATLVYVEEAGHLPHVQTPERFQSLVDEFLKT